MLRWPPETIPSLSPPEVQLPSPRPGVLAALLLPLCSLACAVEAREPETDARLVVLYAPCSVNADFLSPYDESVAFTPHLDAFADESVVFRRHQTESGQSGIAYASLLTGSQCDWHGVYRHPALLDDEVYTITEAYADAGFEPFFWGAHHMAWGRLNYAQGVPEENVFTSYRVHGDPIFTRLLERLRDDRDYRAFVVVHFSEITHSPYRGHRLEDFLARHPEKRGDLSDEDLERYGELYTKRHHNLSFNFPETIEKLGLTDAQVETLARVARLRYESNIELLDELFGAMLSRVADHELMDESLIAFTADHGEVFYRDNALYQWAHGYQLAPEVMHVPFLLRLPDGAADVYENVTRSMDVFPTLAGLSGVELAPERGVQGEDLSRAVLGEVERPELLGYSHTTVLVDRVAHQIQNDVEDWNLLRRTFPDDGVNRIWVAIRDGDTVYKLRALDEEEFVVQVFDLATDPEERHDLFDDTNPRHAEMVEQLNRYKLRLALEHARRSEAVEASMTLSEEEQLRLLQDLGYVR